MGQTEILSDNENKNLNEEMERRMPKNRNASALQKETEENIDNLEQTDNWGYDAPLKKGTQLEFKEDNNTTLTYIIKEEISSGGYGKTYKAEIKGIINSAPVAIKEFCPKGTYRNMKTMTLNIHPMYRENLDTFKKEPERIKELFTSNEEEWDSFNLVIPKSEIFTCYGNYYYVMEYVKGQNLRTFMIENYSNLSIKDRIGIIYQIAIAIRSLHSINCIHQDLSENNIMIRKKNDGSFQIKVIDYGMSTTLYDNSRTRETYIKNGYTHGFSDLKSNKYKYKEYFDSEKERGRIKLIDIYSLGVLLAYTCLIKLDLIKDYRIEDFLTPVFNKEEESVNTVEDEKKKRLNNMILDLIKDATLLNLENRAEKFNCKNDYFGYINEFLCRLDEINAEINKQEIQSTPPSIEIIPENNKNILDKINTKINKHEIQPNSLTEEYNARKRRKISIKKKYFIYVFAVILPTLIILCSILGFSPIDKYIQFSLGKCYYNGIGVTKDESKAVEWYKKAAEQGLAAAQYNLGVCYEDGKGVPKDERKAVEWYVKAAEQGLAAAQNNLGVCYQNGKGVPKDEKKAVEWYKKAAEQGLAVAQNRLGYCYEHGIGVTIDERKAVEWYKKAAEQGLAAAQYNLGNCYLNGIGVTQDTKNAKELYTKAAEQGLAAAQYKLGNINELLALLSDYKKSDKYVKIAVEWYKKAAEQGDEKAKEALKHLSQ